MLASRNEAVCVITDRVKQKVGVLFLENYELDLWTLFVLFEPFGAFLIWLYHTGRTQRPWLSEGSVPTLDSWFETGRRCKPTLGIWQADVRLVLVPNWDNCIRNSIWGKIYAKSNTWINLLWRPRGNKGADESSSMRDHETAQVYALYHQSLVLCTGY